MVTDERLIRSRNDIAAQGFRICASILMVALLYRQLYLGQHPREYWDMFLALFASGIYVNLTTHARGATLAQAETGSSFPRLWRSFARIFVVLVAFNLVRGRIDSLESATGNLLGLLIAAPLAVLVFYLLDRWWKRRSGLDEEE